MTHFSSPGVPLDALVCKSYAKEQNEHRLKKVLNHSSSEIEQSVTYFATEVLRLVVISRANFTMNYNITVVYTQPSLLKRQIMPSTHRRRQHDSAVELSGVSGVNDDVT